MARVVSWPIGIRVSMSGPKSGPRSIGSGSSESLTGFVQSVASPFGLWAWSFSIPPLRGAGFRAWRAFVMALQAGANGARVTMCDPDRWSSADLGITPETDVPWADGQLWDNGLGWSSGLPLESVTAAADAGATIVTLGAATWGGLGGNPPLFGFTGHFGFYVVTEVLADGRWRIWPPLRAAITPDDAATLRPVTVMRLASADLPALDRGVSHAENLTISLVEVEHADVVDYFEV